MDKAKFYEMTNNRLKSEGWENVTQFTRRSGINFSIETVRRAFTQVEGRTIHPDTLAVILFKLKFTDQEVCQMLTEFTESQTTDEYLWPRLSAETISLDNDKQAVLDIYTKVVDSKPELRAKFVEMMSILAMVSDVDISSEANLLRR